MKQALWLLVKNRANNISHTLSYLRSLSTTRILSLFFTINKNELDFIQQAVRSHLPTWQRVAWPKDVTACEKGYSSWIWSIQSLARRLRFIWHETVASQLIYQQDRFSNRKTIYIKCQQRMNCLPMPKKSVCGSGPNQALNEIGILRTHGGDGTDWYKYQGLHHWTNYWWLNEVMFGGIGYATNAKNGRAWLLIGTITAPHTNSHSLLDRRSQRLSIHTIRYNLVWGSRYWRLVAHVC